MNDSTYVDIGTAETYFAGKLHEVAWSDASSEDRNKALVAASRIITRLNFKGYKKPVFDLLYPQGYPNCCANTQVIVPNCVSGDEIRAAETSQELEFPRNSDTEIPQDIQIACCEIAYALLDGIDPDLELENLDVVSQGYASVRSSYSRSRNPTEHLAAGVPSATAWRYLKPYIRDPGGIRISKI
jgi:hypothetical protein